MDEKKRNISDLLGQRLDFMSSRCFCRHLSTLNLRWSTFFLYVIENNTEHSLTTGFIKSLVRQNFVRSDKI